MGDSFLHKENEMMLLRMTCSFGIDTGPLLTRRIQVGPYWFANIVRPSKVT